MNPSRTLGDILIELGKLTEDDARRALAHQQEHGGYFGEALVELGIVTQGEIEWGLASQHDLPYVFPDPDAIDPSAAALVTPEWALAHLTLPMMRSGDVLTVVVDSPLRLEAVQELARRAGCEARLALAPPDRIRAAIQKVYSRGLAETDSDEALPCGLEEALARIRLAGAQRFGISIRDGRGAAWWDSGGTVHRRALDARWGGVLAERMEPPLPQELAGPLQARLSMGGAPVAVELRCLDGDGGREILFRRTEDPDAAALRFTPPPAGLRAEVRLLAHSGAARILVTGTPAEVGSEILPHLPGLLFEVGLRSAHLRHDGPHSGEGLGVRIPVDPEERLTALEALRPFQLDIATVALPGLNASSLRRALDTAAVCLVLGDGPEDVEVAVHAGVRWHLHVRREEGGNLEWSFHALRR